jgi:hypothetical protein
MSLQMKGQALPPLQINMIATNASGLTSQPAIELFGMTAARDDLRRLCAGLPIEGVRAQPSQPIVLAQSQPAPSRQPTAPPPPSAEIVIAMKTSGRLEEDQKTVEFAASLVYEYAFIEYYHNKDIYFDILRIFATKERVVQYSKCIIEKRSWSTFGRTYIWDFLVLSAKKIAAQNVADKWSPVKNGQAIEVMQ